MQNETIHNENAGGVNVYLVGNNPSEISGFRAHLENYRKIRFITRFSFNLKKCLNEIAYWKPQYILLDDAFSSEHIREFISKLRENFYTRETPVALLKTDNRFLPVDDIQDFHLKNNFTPERILASIRNFRNRKKINAYMRLTYRKIRKVGNTILYKNR